MLTHEEIRHVLEQYENNPDQEFLCLASDVFRKHWDVTHSRKALRDYAKEFKRATQLTDYAYGFDDDNFSGQLLFYTRRRRHRAMRVDFLRWLLEQPL